MHNNNIIISLHKHTFTVSFHANVSIAAIHLSSVSQRRYSWWSLAVNSPGCMHVVTESQSWSPCIIDRAKNAWVFTFAFLLIIIFCYSYTIIIIIATAISYTSKFNSKGPCINVILTRANKFCIMQELTWNSDPSQTIHKHNMLLRLIWNTQFDSSYASHFCSKCCMRRRERRTCKSILACHNAADLHSLNARPLSLNYSW
jgi:hypothetical protein